MATAYKPDTRKPKSGQSKHPLYAIWSNMLGRCENERRHDYRFYGGRGITVCERWHDFWEFAADVGGRPSTAHSLDRVDNSKGYEPGNTRWVTHIEQCRNRRTTKLTAAIVIEARKRRSGGERVTDLAREYGVAYTTLKNAILGDKWKAL